MVDFSEMVEKKEISFLDLINYLKRKKVDILIKEIKCTKKTGYVYVNKKYTNKKVILIINNE